MNDRHSRFWRGGIIVALSSSMVFISGCGLLRPTTEPSPSSVAQSPEPQSPGTGGNGTGGEPESPASTPPAVKGWEETLATLKPGVARISVIGCDFSTVGSGFQIDETHVATAAHVVEGAAGITIAVNGQVVTATIVGVNKDDDLALLETSVPVAGYYFSFAEEDPSEGTEVSVLGFPQGENYTTDRGFINGLNIQNGPVFNGRGHILQTSVTINGGNSGGPLVTLDGNVVGVVRSSRVGVVDNGDVFLQFFERTNYVNSGAVAGQLMSSWQAAPQPVAMARCEDTGVATNNQIAVTVDTPDERGTQVAQSLLIHGQAINSGAYELAYHVFTPQARIDQEGSKHWSQAMDTTYWEAIDVSDIQSTSNGIITANARLRTIQDPSHSYDGTQSCSLWNMEYTLEWASYWWEISAARAITSPKPC